MRNPHPEYAAKLSEIISCWTPDKRWEKRVGVCAAKSVCERANWAMGGEWKMVVE